MREAIRASRTHGHGEPGRRHRRASAQRPRVLVSASAVGYYGDRGDGAADGGLGRPARTGSREVCVAWEDAALAAREHGLRVCVLRTGVVLDRRGGALAKMLPPFRLGVGGPVAGGRQYVSWIALAGPLRPLPRGARRRRASTGRSTPPRRRRCTNAELSRALGRALHRPARRCRCPAAALRLLYGEMAEIVTDSQNAVPARALALGHASRSRARAALAPRCAERARGSRARSADRRRTSTSAPAGADAVAVEASSEVSPLRVDAVGAERARGSRRA